MTLRSYCDEGPFSNQEAAVAGVVMASHSQVEGRGRNGKPFPSREPGEE